MSKIEHGFWLMLIIPTLLLGANQAVKSDAKAQDAIQHAKNHYKH